MHITTTILIAAVCCGAAAAQPESQERMSTPPGATALPPGPVEVAMDMSYGKPAVEVMINGRGPFKLLVDTGASPTLILNSDLAEELGLEITGASNVGDPIDPEAIEVQMMRVDSVDLGGAVFSGVETISWDRGTLYSGEGAPRGILGFPLFRDVLVTFDYPRGVLGVAGGRLEPGAHVVEYEATDGIPNIPITIAGLTQAAHLDSGSMAAVMLPMSFAESLDLASEPTEVGRARTVNSDFPIYAADYAGSVTVAGHEVRAESLMFSDVLPRPNIGSQVLGLFAVTFDQERKLARFERDGSAPARIQKPHGSLGLKLGKRGEDYIVAGTIPDTPAAAADLREGDVLVAVNGKPIEDLPPGDLAVEMRKPTVELTIDRGGEERTVKIVRGEG